MNTKVDNFSLYIFTLKVFSFYLNDVSYEYPSSSGYEITSHTACREYSFHFLVLGLDGVLVLGLDQVLVLGLDQVLVLGLDQVLVPGLDQALVLGLELTLDLVLVPVLLEDED